MTVVDELYAERARYTAELPELERRPGLTPFKRMALLKGPIHGQGSLYLCACGWSGWTAWGRAKRHARLCPLSDAPPLQLPGLEVSE